MISRSAIIRGTQVNYYFICHTKLWLFSHFIQMENTSELVALGKLLHEQAYSRAKKDEMIDNTISIDFIRKKGSLELHEIKKSNRMEKAHVYQMMYYLWYLKKRGVQAYGIIDYPKLRRRVRVDLTEEKKKELGEILKKIKEIVSMPAPPQPKRKSICSKCSYVEFCFCEEG